MHKEEMLNCDNPGNLNAVMFSRHFLDCDVVFAKIRSILLFEISPVKLSRQFGLTDRSRIGELYQQFVAINPFMLQVVQVLLSNHIKVIPYEYENDYFDSEVWDQWIVRVGYPNMESSFVFAKDSLNSDKPFLRFVNQNEKIGFISTKPLTLAKFYLYPFRVYPNLNEMPYSYRANISNKLFQLLYNNFINNTLFHGVSPRTNAYIYGFARVGPLYYILAKIIHQRLTEGSYDRVYFMAPAYLLFLCYQKLYSTKHHAAMLEDRLEGDKVLIVDFGKGHNHLQSGSKNIGRTSVGKEIDFFKWRIAKKYRNAFHELTELLSEMPFDLLKYAYATADYLPYPKNYQDNRVLSEIYQGTEDFIEKFSRFIPDALEEKLGILPVKDGFELYLQDKKRKRKFSIYGWLKKNKLVRRLYSSLKRRLSS